MPLFFQLSFADEQFLAQQFAGIINRQTQQVINTQKLRAVGNNYTRVWRNRNFTIGKRIQSINGNIGRNTWCQVNLNFNILGRIVDYLFNFDFATVVGFQNRIN